MVNTLVEPGIQRQSRATLRRGHTKGTLGAHRVVSSLQSLGSLTAAQDSETCASSPSFSFPALDEHIEIAQVYQHSAERPAMSLTLARAKRR